MSREIGLDEFATSIFSLAKCRGADRHHETFRASVAHLLRTMRLTAARARFGPFLDFPQCLLSSRISFRLTKIQGTKDHHGVSTAYEDGDRRDAETRYWHRFWNNLQRVRGFVNFGIPAGRLTISITPEWLGRSRNVSTILKLYGHGRGVATVKNPTPKLDQKEQSG